MSIIAARNKRDRSWDVDFSEITLKQQIGNVSCERE
jgi:hypothetical protein